MIDLHQNTAKYVSRFFVLVCLVGAVFAAPLRPLSEDAANGGADRFSVERPDDQKSETAREPGRRRARQGAASAQAAGDSSGRAVPRDEIPVLPVAADGNTLPPDTPRFDSLLMPDSLAMRPDSAKKHVRDTASKPFLDAPIFGKSVDSLVYIVPDKDIYSYSNSEVKYQDMEVKGADFLKINTQTKDIHAHGIYDTLQTGEGTYSRFTFVQKKDEFEMDSIRYNMTSQKARIQGVNTREGEGFLRGDTIKRMPDNVIHMHHGRYTTCDAECPHFYLQMTKASVVPGKKTVFGPAYLVFEDVPIPFLGLPFGFFPQKSGRDSGFIFPEVGEEVVKGFFLRDGGYYFVLGENIDVTALGGIYTLGSWEGSLTTSYNKRYKYSGGFSFDYAKDIIGEKGAPDYLNTGNMKIMWTHQQDAKANPTSKFSASVNYTTSSYNKYNATNMNDYLNSQVSSSMAYSKNWAGKPFSLSVNAMMSQNSRDSSFTLNMPSMSFNVQRINPFKRKVVIGKERWYEKIQFTYSADFKNSVTAKESELFQQEMFDKMSMGVNHKIPINASFSIFKGRISLTPGVNYNERWYFRKINREYNPETKRAENSDTTRGFFRVNDYNMNLSATSKLYGTFEFGDQAVILRHVMTPTVSFSYTPAFDKYWEVVRDRDSSASYYSPFSGEPYGVPGRNRAASINFGLGNTLEMKVRSDKDTTGYKKVKIFESFNISSNWNFLADSLNLANFAVSARATIVKGLSINATASLDPYQYVMVTNANGNQTGQKVNKFMGIRKGLVRLTSLNFSFSYGFQSSASRNDSRQSAINNPENNRNSMTPDQIEQEDFFNQNQGAQRVQQAQILATQYYDFSIPWSVSMSYSFGYTKPTNVVNVSQTVNFSGNANITKNWAVSLSAGYDFKMKKLTPGAVQVSRDLHCFQLNFNWVPIGYRQSWSFTIRAKSAMLADLLRWKKTRSFLDNYYGY